jgi:hypothetical protein
MIAELNPIAKAELVASSWQFAQLGNYIADMFFHSESLIGLEFLLAAHRHATKPPA